MLLGREGQPAVVRDAVRAVAGGAGSCLLVEGEPGAGRSTLLRALADMAGGHGCRVRAGAADPLSVQLPLRAALDCLHPDGVRPPGAPDLRATVAGLLMAADRPEAGLAAALDTLVTGVEDWCAERPLVLVLDDLQAADPASLLLWQRLGRATARLPLLLAAALRGGVQRPEVEQLCAALDRAGGRRLPLRPLDDRQTAAVIRAQLGAPPGPRLRELAGRAGGNPRYLRQLIAHWAALGVLDVGPERAEPAVRDRDLPAPPAALARRALDFLSPAAYELLRHAALLGEEFTVRELACVLDRPARALLCVLEEPVAAGLLRDTGDRLAFRHPVVRQALYADLPGSLRSALHRDGARALAGAAEPPARTAEQLLAAGRLDPWALDWLAGAAGQLITDSPGLAADLIERAIAQDTGPAEEGRQALEEHLAEAALMLRRPESVALLSTLCERAGDPDRRAALEFKLVSALMVRGDMAQSLEVTERALAREFPDPGLRVRLEACRVLALAELGRPVEAHGLAGAVVADAAVLGDPLCGAEAHHAMSFALYRLGREAESLRHIAEGIGCARRSPQANDMRLLLLANQAEGHTRLDQPLIVGKALSEARELAQRARSTGRLMGTEARFAEFHYRYGRWDQALAAAGRAEALRTSDAWLPVVVRGLRALILAHRDQPVMARRELARLPQEVFQVVLARRYACYVLLARAQLAERAGRPAEALRDLLPALSEAYAEAAPPDRHEVLPEIVRLALETGDTATARLAVDACEELAAGVPASPGPATAVLRCRGLFGQDPVLLAQVVERAERESRPLLLGRSLEDLAVALAWHGELAPARAALTRAVGAYQGLGAHWDLARADTRLRRLGVRRGSRSARRKVRDGWEALTPAELKVALLVAQGRSNPEIAAELFLSRRTVQTHVSHILGKLQVRSRTQVAAQAAAQAASQAASEAAAQAATQAASEAAAQAATQAASEAAAQAARRAASEAAAQAARRAGTAGP
ncbi:AAA family ATPase [Streptomyces sp. NPDC051211]|uniref:ATP-binding protein n=1 Tax=Streptomyces sp. NPDC051211 TaxID=3154643 RepID=UPI00344B4341